MKLYDPTISDQNVTVNAVVSSWDALQEQVSGKTFWFDFKILCQFCFNGWHFSPLNKEL